MASATRDPILLNGKIARFLFRATKAERRQYLKGLSFQDTEALTHDWAEWGRPDQQMPRGEWHICLMRTGRGWGKTTTLSEWGHLLADQRPGHHMALTARSAADVRDVMIQGPAGLLSRQKPWNPCRYLKSERKVIWANGTYATAYSSMEPDLLRGQEHHTALNDEWATWTRAKASEGGMAWDHVLLSTRVDHKVGKKRYRPKVMVGTTPRPTPQMRDLVEDTRVIQIVGSLFANIANLSDQYREFIVAKYAGTRMGRQEIDGEILDMIEGALVEIEWINEARVVEGSRPEPMVRIVIGVDPATTSGEKSDSTGIVVCGLGEDGDGYVIEDLTCKKSPKGWAEVVVDAFHRYHADLVVAETNQGGEMVERNIMAADPNVNYKGVHAKVGKKLRFEPVANLYEQRRIHHPADQRETNPEGQANLDQLEAQICAFTIDEYAGLDSPDDVDAEVYAMTELMFGPQEERIVSLGNVGAADRKSGWGV